MKSACNEVRVFSPGSIIWRNHMHGGWTAGQSSGSVASAKRETAAQRTWCGGRTSSLSPRIFVCLSLCRRLCRVQSSQSCSSLNDPLERAGEEKNLMWRLLWISLVTPFFFSVSLRLSVLSARHTPYRLTALEKKIHFYYVTVLQLTPIAERETFCYQHQITYSSNFSRSRLQSERVKQHTQWKNGQPGTQNMWRIEPKIAFKVKTPRRDSF